MSIVLQIGHDQRKIRELPATQVCGELRKRYKIRGLRAAVHDIGKIREWVVIFGVRIRPVGHVSVRGQAFRIGPPRFACSDQVVNDVIRIYSAAERIVIRDDLTRGQHEVVAD